MNGDDEEENTVEQPAGMSKTLFPHQLKGIWLLEERENKQTIVSDNYLLQTNVGIFADIAGYGKTLALVGLIKRNRMAWDLKEPYIVSNFSNIYGNGSIIKKSLLRFQRIDTTLIVASTSILKQWSEEISTTRLSHVIITVRKKLDGLEPTMYDIILCSPLLYNYLINKYPNYAWKRFIYDEPVQTKIIGMRFIVSGFIWFVTATPVELLYHNHSNQNFLQSIFSNCMDYHIFQNLIVKNDDEFVKHSFSLPPIYRHYHQSHQPLYNVVKNILSDSISDLIGAGNIEKAIRQLGGTSTSNIFSLIEEEKVEQVREARYKIEKFRRLNDTSRLQKWMHRQQQLEKEIEELKRRYKEFIINEMCQICLAKNDQPVLVSCCQNAYCGKCIIEWLKTKSSCPHCRSLITTDKIIYLKQENDRHEYTDALPNSRTKKTKQAIILDIIESKPKGKIIIFSDYDETFSPIRNALQEEGIFFAEICGTRESREKKIDSFKHGDLSVLFLNSMANGAGINLQEASDIILYHRMSESQETQVIGRAYRIGRTKPLDIHYLV